MSLVVLFQTSAIALVAWLLVRYAVKLARKPKLDMVYLEFEDGDNSMQRYLNDTWRLLERGYEEYLKKGVPFAMFNYMDTSTPIVVLPAKYLAEVRSASASQLSFPRFLNKSTYAEEIGAPLVTDRVIHLVRQDLNKALNGLIQPLQQTCDHALKASIPPCPDWTLVNGQMLLWPLISRLITLALLGPELASSEEWFGVVMAYFQAGRSALQRIRDEYQPWLRWAAKYFDNDVKAIYAARRRGEEILKPVIEARIADAVARASNGQQQPGFNDGIQWLVDSYRAENKPVKASEIMQDVAFLLAASLESTTVNALSILFDLVERPESVAEIRKEVSTVYAEHGGWNRQSLAALRTLDSFLKESQRLNTFQFNTMQRMAVEDFTFKDGLLIPAGTSIVMPSRLLGRDPALHTGAVKFDAQRWKRKRDEGDATKFHFASLEDNMLPWGSGPHACPGRFLVQEVIKMIFIGLVTNYDIKFADGVSRPPDLLQHAGANPNAMAMLLFRERSL